MMILRKVGRMFLETREDFIAAALDPANKIFYKKLQHQSKLLPQGKNRAQIIQHLYSQRTNVLQQHDNNKHLGASMLSNVYLKYYIVDPQLWNELVLTVTEDTRTVDVDFKNFVTNLCQLALIAYRLNDTKTHVREIRLNEIINKYDVTKLLQKVKDSTPSRTTCLAFTSISILINKISKLSDISLHNHREMVSQSIGKFASHLNLLNEMSQLLYTAAMAGVSKQKVTPHLNKILSRPLNSCHQKTLKQLSQIIAQYGFESQNQAQFFMTNLLANHNIKSIALFSYVVQSGYRNKQNIMSMMRKVVPEDYRHMSFIDRKILHGAYHILRVNRIIDKQEILPHEKKIATNCSGMQNWAIEQIKGKQVFSMCLQNNHHHDPATKNEQPITSHFLQLSFYKIFARHQHRMPNYKIYQQCMFCQYQMDIVLISEKDKVVVQLSGRHYRREDGEFMYKKKIRNKILSSYGFRLVHFFTNQREIIDYLKMQEEKSWQIVKPKLNLLDDQ